jgi:hypothetical protein
VPKNTSGYFGDTDQPKSAPKSLTFRGLKNLIFRSILTHLTPIHNFGYYELLDKKMAPYHPTSRKKHYFVIVLTRSRFVAFPFSP